MRLGLISPLRLLFLSILFVSAGYFNPAFSSNSVFVLNPESDWHLSKVDNSEKSNSLGYCSAFRKYTNNLMLTMAKNTEGNVSVAMDFRRDVLESDKDYLTVMSSGSITNKQTLKPASKRAFVIRGDKNIEIINHARTSEKLDISVGDNTYRFNVNKISGIIERIDNCIASLENKPADIAINDIKPKPKEQLNSPDTSIKQDISGDETFLSARNNQQSFDTVKTKDVLDVNQEIKSEHAPVAPPVTKQIFDNIPETSGSMADAGNKITSLKSEIIDLKRENEKLASSLAKARREYENSMNQVQGSPVISELQEKLDILERENNALKKSTNIPENQQANMSFNAQDNEKVKELEEQVVNLTESNFKLQSKLNDISSGSGENSRNVSATSEILAIQEENKALMTKLNQANDLISNLQMKINDSITQNNTEELEAQLRNALSEKRQLQSEIAEIERLRSKNNEYEKIMGDLNEQISILHDKNNLLQSDLTLANKAIDSIRADMVASNSTEKTSALQEKLNDTISEKNDLENALRQTSGKQAEIEKLYKDIEKLREDLFLARRENNLLREQINQTKEKSVSLGSSEKNSYEDKIASLNMRIRELEGENKTLYKSFERIADSEQNTQSYANSRSGRYDDYNSYASNNSSSKDSGGFGLISALKSIPKAIGETIYGDNEDTPSYEDDTVYATQLSSIAPGAGKLTKNPIQNETDNVLLGHSISPSSTGSPGIWKEALQDNNTTYGQNQNSTTRNIMFMSRNDIFALLNSAGININKNSISESDTISTPSLNAVKWTTANGFFGTAIQKAMKRGDDYQSMINNYINRAKSRCNGDFAYSASEANQPVYGIRNMTKYELACIGNTVDSSASVLFFDNNGIFTTISHETTTDNMSIIIELRDKLAQMVSSYTDSISSNTNSYYGR